MLLIGMFDSPFVRRVAISLQLLELPFEHADWSVGRDFERIREYNPLGRVPTLVLDDGEVIGESGAILDYLDDQAGPGRALLPRSGQQRREALRLIALAVGAAEKGREVIYEGAFRPAEKRHEPWLERCRTQLHGALGALDQACTRLDGRRWLLGAALTQPDVTLTCVCTFLHESVGIADLPARYPAVSALASRCELRPEFQATHRAFFNPGGQ